jgi:hypothetical protein
VLLYITSLPAFCCCCFLLAGNEPLAPGAVKLGTGTAAEAKAAAGNVCSQLVLLGGELSMQSMLGPRTAAVKNVAMNRTLAAGASVKKVGAADACDTQACHGIFTNMGGGVAVVCAEWCP